jgi:SAM-dependent methyltransferase
MSAALRDYTAFNTFLDGLTGDIYPEVPAEPHLSITKAEIDGLHRDGLIIAGMRVLDVGCGQGVAMDKFRDLSLEAVGITLGADGDLCRAKDLDVREMDQNFMTFADNEFDLLWCRHVLEHSIAPLFTLSEYRRVLKPGGLAYVEVPAPDTSARHETNPNHYGVLPLSAWFNLFSRAGFAVEHSVASASRLPAGPTSTGRSCFAATNLLQREAPTPDIRIWSQNTERSSDPALMVHAGQDSRAALAVTL